MARTDKDMPRYAQNADAAHGEWHNGCEHDGDFTALHGTRHECNLGVGPGECTYFRHGSYSGAGRKMEHLAFYGPERASVRDTLRLAAAEYNSLGHTDVEPEPRQARCSPWGGGFWD